MITDALTRPTRSLREYAEELRAEYERLCDRIMEYPDYLRVPLDLMWRAASARERLMAVETEINARACI